MNPHPTLQYPPSALQNTKCALHILTHWFQPFGPTNLIDVIGISERRNSAWPPQITVVAYQIYAFEMSFRGLVARNQCHSRDSTITNARHKCIQSYHRLWSFHLPGPPFVVCNMWRRWLHVKLNVLVVVNSLHPDDCFLGCTHNVLRQCEYSHTNQHIQENQPRWSLSCSTGPPTNEQELLPISDKEHCSIQNE